MGTPTEEYNLIVADLFNEVPVMWIESEAGQVIIRYFMNHVKARLEELRNEAEDRVLANQGMAEYAEGLKLEDSPLCRMPVTVHTRSLGSTEPFKESIAPCILPLGHEGGHEAYWTPDRSVLHSES